MYNLTLMIKLKNDRYMDKNVEKKIKMFAKEVKNGIMDDMSTEQSVQFLVEGLKMCLTSKNEG